MINKIKVWAQKLKSELIILHLAYKDHRTPWYVKALIVFIIAYALSPIDLIPDFIPVLGYLDDLILLPLGIYIAIKMIPEQVIENARAMSQSYIWRKERSLTGFIIVILIWLVLAIYLGFRIFYQ